MIVPRLGDPDLAIQTADGLAGAVALYAENAAFVHFSLPAGPVGLAVVSAESHGATSLV